MEYKFADKKTVDEFHERVFELGYDVTRRGFYDFDTYDEFVIEGNERTVVINEKVLEDVKNTQMLDKVIQYIKDEMNGTQ